MDLTAVPALVEVLTSSTVMWLLVGIGLYWLALIAASQLDLLPSYIGTQGPIVTVHTVRGKEFLDRLSRPKRFWRAWSNFGIGISLVVMTAMFVFLLVAGFFSLSQPEPTGIQEPQNVLVIPGVNDFLPLSAAPGIIFGLLVGLVVHEGGHGLLCRVEDIDIESMGVALFAIIPIGAFVQPDQENAKSANRGAQTRMFAAGVTNNFAITIVAFALLFGPIAGSIALASGAAVGGVAPDSSAAAAGVEPNDRITAVDGEPVEHNEELAERLEATDAATVTLELNGGEETVTVERSLVVSAATEDGPTGLGAGDAINAVEGVAVGTQGGFFEAVGDEHIVTVTIERDGSELEREIPVGALVSLTDDGPFAEAGGPTNGEAVITAIGDERVYTHEDLQDALAETEPDDVVTVTAVVDGEVETYDVTLGDHPQDDIGFLGITAVQGVSGVAMSDLGLQLYPAEEYLAILGGEGESSFGPTDTFLGKIGIVLFLPIIGVLGVLPFNFAGFTGGVENFYVAQGPLAAFGDGTVFLIANLLFWTGWINVQLGFFNCIPAFPLDGGHILRTTTEAILSRIPIETTRGMVRTVTTTVGLAMLVSFLLLLFGPQLAG